jgi:hypothetical protein
MVYAPYGRTGIYMLQEFCRRVGIHPSDAEIRDLIRALGALPAGHPLQSILTQTPELRDEGTLADSLLHPQDRAYSVPKFFEFIENAELTFGRWLRQAPYSVHCGVIAQIPQAAEIARLPLPEQYAAIELFRGTMIRHSAVVSRNDCKNGPQPFNTPGDDLFEYVPVRMPDAVCIQDRLPTGTAAVLINRSHAYKDLFLTLNRTEKRLFDGIDGRRTIMAIVERTLSSGHGMRSDVARHFFERLWWHDQVLFDTGVGARETGVVSRAFYQV